MRRDGLRGSWGLGFEKRMKGDGRGCSGGALKLLRSSWKNLEGGGFSVNTSSIFSVSKMQLASKRGTQTEHTAIQTQTTFFGFKLTQIIYQRGRQQTHTELN